MKLNTLRWICLAILAVLTFLLGLIRYQYVINLINPSLPLLLPRDFAENSAYPFSIHEIWTSFKTDPRWLSSVIYFSYPAIATVSAAFLLFNKKSYLLITLFFYGIGLISLIMMVCGSMLIKEYPIGYGLAQHVKKIFQEPYISLLLLSGFYWNEEKIKKSK